MITISAVRQTPFICPMQYYPRFKIIVTDDEATLHTMMSYDHPQETFDKIYRMAEQIVEAGFNVEIRKFYYQ